MIDFSKLSKNKEFDDEQKCKEKGCLKFERQFNGGYIRNLVSLIFPFIGKIRSEAETLNLIKKSGLGNDETSCKNILGELTEDVYPISPNDDGFSLIKSKKNNYRVERTQAYFSPL